MKGKVPSYFFFKWKIIYQLYFIILENRSACMCFYTYKYKLGVTFVVSKLYQAVILNITKSPTYSHGQQERAIVLNN